MGQDSSKNSCDYIWEHWAEHNIALPLELQKLKSKETIDPIRDIGEILNAYQLWKSDHGKKMPLDQDGWCFAYTLGKMCVRWKPNNSNLVAKVLQCLMECNNYSVFVFDVIYDEIKHSQESTGNSTIHYFLHNANNARLMVKGERFVSSFFDLMSRWVFPLHTMLDGTLPRSKVLQCILRYGALMCRPSENGEPEGIPPNLLEFLNIIVYKIYKIIGQNIPKSLPLDQQNNNLNDMIKSLRLLGFVVPQMRLSYFNNQVNFYKWREGHPATCRSYIHRLYECTDNFRLQVTNDCSQPSSLLHLCRCQIRHQLWKNWHLPDGTELLPLPSTMKKFLNIDNN